MKRKIRICGIFLMVIFILTSCVVPCFAEAPLCNITVSLKDKEDIEGFEVSLCKVADLQDDKYSPAKGFESSGISFYGIANNPSQENAETVLKYIKDKNIKSKSKKSLQGKVKFDKLTMGIYLVFARDNQEYKFTPYFVFLPFVLEGKLYYEVESEPKIQKNTENSKSIYVIKKWKDKEDEAGLRPDKIKVDLKKNGKVIKTVKLSEENAWSHTFLNLPEKGRYSVEERKVEGYTPSYDGDSENGFIITNILDGESLPVAGQLWWPIACIVVAGISFIILGIVQLKDKKNEE